MIPPRSPVFAAPILTAKGRKLIAVSSVMPEDYRGPLPSARRWVELCRRDMPHLDVRYFVRSGETMFTNVEKACLVARRRSSRRAIRDRRACYGRRRARARA